MIVRKLAVNGDANGYYSDRLSAQRLRKCYEIAPPRARQYLDAEIRHVASRIYQYDVVLELGCGYGRVIEKLADKARMLVGIDTSLSSLQLAGKLLTGVSNCRFAQMDAAVLGFRDRSFDVVVCIQNGLSAFKVDPSALIEESIRVARPGGRILFSSYSEKFWKDRFEWFQLQSDHGLLGEIDRDATHDGVIVCKDGFTATTISPDEFLSLASEFNVDPRIEEVDESSLFCEITV